MKFLIILLIIINGLNAKPLILSTNQVTDLIISEITGNRIETDFVEIIPGHKSKFSSSDIFRFNAADAIFYLSDSLEKEITSIPIKNKISIFDFIQDSIKLKNNYGKFYDLYVDSLLFTVQDTLVKDSLFAEYYQDSSFNHYYFLNPVIINRILPLISDKLGELFPDLSNYFSANTERFSKRLELLDKQIIHELEKVEGMPVYFEFPFMDYYINQYNLSYAGSLKTPYLFGESYTSGLIYDMEKIGINSLFAVKSDLKIENVKIIKLDIFATQKEHNSYSEYLLSLTREIKSALLFY